MAEIFTPYEGIEISELKDDVKFSTGSRNVADSIHAQRKQSNYRIVYANK